MTRSKIRSSLCPTLSIIDSPFPSFLTLSSSPSLSAMDAVNEAMKALKQVALKERDKGLSERVDALMTTLRLLVLSSTRNLIEKAPSRTLTCRISLSVLTPRYSKSSWWRSDNRLFRYTKIFRSRPSNSLRGSFHSCSTRR